jgi:poly(A) polymerase
MIFVVEASLRFRYSTNEKGNLVKKAVVYTSEEHGINYSDVDPQAVYIVERLWANGFETYIVGGAVRDLILRKKPKDFDIVSAANPTRIKKVFNNARVIGNRFRLVHVYFGQKVFEVSTFRSMKDGPTSNTFGTIEEDVLRRDFTMNALFYDPMKQVVVDFLGGMKDIKVKKIRPIIPLSHIFTDDPVRMIRAVKYGAVAESKLSIPLRMKIRRQSSLLAAVSASRLTEEIFKILYSSHAAQIVDDLDSLGLYKYLQPQAALLFKTKQGFREQYLKSLGSINLTKFKNLPGEALAALIRDFLEETADWNGNNDELSATPQERYKEAFAAARKFVIPMNPPRIELDRAVKLLFAEHGVTIKRSRFTERHVNKTPRQGAKTPREESNQQPRPDGAEY